MARYISIADGDWSNVTTWAETVAAAERDSQAASQTLGTSASGGASPSFTPGAIGDADGVALKFRNRLGSTGTITVELYDVTNATVRASCTVPVTVLSSNYQDSAHTEHYGLGWYFFKFATAWTLAAATDYAIRVYTSNANQVNAWTDGTSNHWSQQLRLTSNPGSLAADDAFIVAGTHNDDDSVDTVTVTYDDTSGTDWGKIDVCNQATLEPENAASTAYVLKTSGQLDVWPAATMTIGTSGDTIQQGSTFELILDCTTAGEFGLVVRVGATVNLAGAAKTARLELAADASASATSITLSDTPTNWQSGDELGLTATNATKTQSEIKALGADVGSTTATIAALTNAHKGTGDSICQVANLTRNVLIRGASASLPAYVYLCGLTSACGTFLAQDVVFKWMGTSTSGKRGLEFNNTVAANVDLVNCVARNFEAAGARGFAAVATAAPGGASDLTTCVTWNIYAEHVYHIAGTGVFDQDDTLHVTQTDTAVGMVHAENAGSELDGIFCVGATGYGIYVSLSASATPAPWSNWDLRACNYGFAIVGRVTSAQLDTVKVCDCTTSHLISGCISPRNAPLTIIDCTIRNVPAFSGPIILLQSCYAVRHESLDISSAVIVISCIGTDVYAGGLEWIDCTASVTSSFFGFIGAISGLSQSRAYNLDKGSLDIGVVDTVGGGGYFWSRSEGGTEGNDVDYTTSGRDTYDATIYRPELGAPSLRLYATVLKTQAHRHRTRPFRVSARAGEEVEVRVYVRKSASGDGAAYTGDQPRLRVLADEAMGYNVDTTLATAIAANGTWEELVATLDAAPQDGTFFLYLDSNTDSGTPGWVNVHQVRYPSQRNAGDRFYAGREGHEAGAFPVQLPQLHASGI